MISALFVGLIEVVIWLVILVFLILVYTKLRRHIKQHEAFEKQMAGTPCPLGRLAVGMRDLKKTATQSGDEEKQPDEATARRSRPRVGTNDGR